VQSGGTSRVSGVAFSLFLGAGILGAAPLLGQVPIATLVGVMFLVCHSTFAWSSLRLVGRIPRVDLLIIALVSAVTVFKDLAVAVTAGTVVSALSFAWQQSTAITAETSTATAAKGRLIPQTWKTYRLKGPLFFGSTQAFSGLFRPKNDPSDVVIDFLQSRVVDHSALEAINALAAKYGERGKRVHLRHLSSDCAGLLERLNGGARDYELIEAEPTEDPVYEVVEDSRLYRDIAVPKAPRAAESPTSAASGADESAPSANADGDSASGASGA